MTPELTARIDALIARELPNANWSHKPAIEDPRALLVMSTEALFAYYLAPDGTVYELDLDRSPRYEKVESAERVAEVYAAAARKFPELAALVSVDATALPRTLAEALTYPGHVVIAEDLANASGNELVAFTVGLHGARELVRGPRTGTERVDAVTLGGLVWHVELASRFNAYDATRRLTEYVWPSDVARVRSSGGTVDLVSPGGDSTRIVTDVPPAVARRLARDFANSLEREHEHDGKPRTNERDLGLVHACRELEARKVARVDLGAGIALELVGGDLVLVLGTRRSTLRPRADHTYLTGFLPVYDVARAILQARE